MSHLELTKAPPQGLSPTAALMQIKIVGFALAIYQSVGYNGREVTRSIKAGREEFAPPHAPMQEAR